MSFEDAERVDIPSHIMRERLFGLYLIDEKRYTLTYNEGT